MPLQGDRCLFYGSSNLVRIESAFCTDISESPKPQVTAYSLEVRKCRNCRRTLRGQHLQVDPSQHGARAHRVGNGVFTCTHALHYGIGVPMRKVSMILRELCGVSITQSAIQQDAMRRNQAEVGEEYQQLCASVKDAKRVFTDGVASLSCRGSKGLATHPPPAHNQALNVRRETPTVRSIPRILDLSR